ncbi:MAG: hypothetical protein DMG58_36765, partial [Acidobacteria bacterium]
GHTFRGWALSYLGRQDEATEECKQAIELDPDFGIHTMTSAST